MVGSDDLRGDGRILRSRRGWLDLTVLPLCGLARYSMRFTATYYALT